MQLPIVHNPNELLELVERFGFLPFFANEIKGFSIEECCPSELWFAENTDGPWEWKGPMAQSSRCIYGKFFRGKAGYVSREWLPDFVNYRRNGYDFDARYENGLASHKDKEIYKAIIKQDPLLSKELKKICNYRKGENTGFDTVITRLQMQTYVITADFVYMKDKYGRPYGWGVAKYGTPEKLFGHETVTAAYHRNPEESKRRICEHLSAHLTDVSEKQIFKLVR